jgi:hypothetical protein
MDWIIALFMLVALSVLLGGTVLILISRQAPWRTRLRWVAVSVAPLIFMILVLAVFSPKGPGGEEEEFGLVGRLLSSLLGMAVIAANWMTYSAYRSSLSKSSPKSP